MRKIMFAVALCAAVAHAQSPSVKPPVFNQDYVVLGWNDLGMHCMNNDFSSLIVLPPFNNLWAQVIKRGDPPRLVSQGVVLTYRFPNNTSSADKVNFWQYGPSVFGPLQPDVGLTGNGLSGTMKWNGTAFEASGVPITPYEDSAPTFEQPYQVAEVKLYDRATSAVLDTTQFVVPVSTELHCEKCHINTGEPGDSWAPSGLSVYDNILTFHDNENGTHLMASRPVLCASCHGSNALGTTGNPNLSNLSRAIHRQHLEANGIGCYDCHPGPKTQCLRGAMYLHGKKCEDCHGNMSQLSQGLTAGRQPWLEEPVCSSAQCHPTLVGKQDQPLYRNSRGHSGLYCEACHNSTHAEMPTAQPRDAVQMLRVQGQATFLQNCLVCHTKQPTGAGPHGAVAPSNGVKLMDWANY